MSLGQVDKDISQAAPGKDLPSVWWFAVRELAEVVRKQRTRWNAFASLVDSGYVEIGTGRIYFATSATGPFATAGVPEGSALFDTNPARAFTLYSLVGGGWNPVI